MISRGDLSDEDLDLIIKYVRNELLALVAVKKSKGQDVHVPIDWKFVRKSTDIVEVKCSCKHVTKYRVPLKNIEEFECPKEKKPKPVIASTLHPPIKMGVFTGKEKHGKVQ